MTADPDAEIRVDEPWAGYRQMTTVDVLERIATADETELALVHLFETTHRQRRMILDAVERRALRRAS